jgi:RNA polymerase sigma factor (sigma-70 family)
MAQPPNANPTNNDLVILEEVIRSCLRRISHWRVPPNYSPIDWRKEMSLLASAAAWQALCDYDPRRRVPLGAFVRQRVMTCALTRFRQEWAYAVRHVSQTDDQTGDGEHGGSIEGPLSGSPEHEVLWLALMQLPKGDRRLLKQIFWDRCTEADIAKETEISHQAVSKRKQLALNKLRALLGGVVHCH